MQEPRRSGTGARKPDDPLVDGDRLLELTARLRRLHERIADADIVGRDRERLTRSLVAVSEAAKGDLDAAERDLRRLETELERRAGGHER